MTLLGWPLMFLLAQAGTPSQLPPGHPPIAPEATSPGAGGQQGQPPTQLPPGHPPIAPGATPPGAGGQQGQPPGQLPPGHPATSPGAAPPTVDELLRKMDAQPDLKSRPKPFEIAAAVGKLYYGQGRWADARDFLQQAQQGAAPLRALFLTERRQAQGPLPTAEAAGCRVSSETAVQAAAEKARALAAKKTHGPAAACALEALGPALEGTALLGNALALLGDSTAALAAYAWVLEVEPKAPQALYGHAAVLFDTRSDDLRALRTARAELQTYLEAWPSLPQTPQARALLQRTDALLTAGGATKLAEAEARARRQSPPLASAAPVAGTAAGAAGAAAAGNASGPAAPPPLSQETIQAIQNAQRTPEMEANLARLLDDGESKLVSGRYAEAFEDFKQVMPFQPNNGRLRAGMAWALVGLKRQPMADNIWRVAVSSDPAAVDALGDRLLQRGNAADAQALWTKLVASAPEYSARSGVEKKLKR
jgi:tetratricopeptide (TPR) repeat protein